MTSLMKKFQFGLAIVLGYIAILLSGPIVKLITNATAPDLFSVQIVLRDSPIPNIKPSIRYTRIAQVPLEGIWVAVVQELHDGGFRPVCDGSGKGVYLPETSGLVNMSWSYFIGTDCDVPEVPYRICTHYKLSESGKPAQGYGQFCSDIRQPDPMD
jgi:hypothetical protein